MIVAAIVLTAQAAPLPQCRAAQLQISLSSEGGEFNGMSHSGTRLALRNGGAKCMLPALPVVEFRDARGRSLAAKRRPPGSIHPEPELSLVRLGRGQTVTTDIRWVSSPVYSPSRELRAASIALRAKGGIVCASISAHLYGEAGKMVMFEQSALAFR